MRAIINYHSYIFQVGFRDMEHEDYAFYKSMVFLLENDLADCGKFPFGQFRITEGAPLTEFPLLSII